MTDFYLITGFLGAGKTTLLRAILPHFRGKKMRLIINEFGKVGMDGTLLRDYGADISEIVNGSIFCVCKLDQFERALEEAMAGEPDVILVETSGLSDPGSIRSILAEYERLGSLRYRGAICLVDALRFPKVIETARACKKQLAVSDVVLLNKCDLVSEDVCAAVEHRIKGLCFAPVLRTTYGAISQELLERLEREKPKGAISVTRFKGLGEMNPAQLRESTMHPDTRRLVQLTVEDRADTHALLDMLLAKKRSAERKQWLERKGDLATLEV